MRYLRLYTGPDEASHLEDVAAALRPGGGASDLSETIALAGAAFVRLPSGYARDFHTAPWRQFVVTLAGAIELATGDGSVRRVGVETVLLAEDTTGQGHITRVPGVDWLGMWLPLAGEPHTLTPAEPAADGEPFTSYFRIVDGPDGASRFEDVPVRAAQQLANGRRISAPLAATGLMFRRSAPDQHIDWHPAPRLQFVITLAGAAAIEAGSGEVRRVGPGSVMLAADTRGRGHITRAAGGRERLSLFVPLAEG